METDDRSAGGGLLPFAGTMLVLAGLFSGLAVEAMENPRMGLSAHLEGVMNGVLLLAVGANWHRLALPPLLRRVAIALLLYATWINWLSVQLAALWGTGRLTPIAAPDREGAPWQEGIVTFGLISISIAMIAAFVILAIGFWKARRT